VVEMGAVEFARVYFFLLEFSATRENRNNTIGNVSALRRLRSDFNSRDKPRDDYQVERIPLSRAAQNFDRRQYRAEFQQPATSWAGTALRRVDLGDRQIDSETVAQFDQATNPIESNLAVGIHKAVVANFHETSGQHMLQETADEFHDIKSQDSGALAVRLAIANEHRTILEVDDARVGDRDFEDVGSEVFEASFAGGYRLAVDVPGDLPDIVGNLIQQFCLLHQIVELGAKDDRERFDRQKEIDSGRMPRTIQ